MRDPVPMSMGQNTGAAKACWMKLMGKGSNGARKRRPKAPGRKRARARAAPKSKRARAARLVKGSAAAKRYMARIRKLRKR
jgi:hypothetical protein